MYVEKIGNSRYELTFPLIDWFEFKRENKNSPEIIDKFYFEFGIRLNQHFAAMFLELKNLSIKDILLLQKRVLEKLINDFQKVYSKNERIEGNYFDDLCYLELLNVNQNLADREEEEKRDELRIKNLIEEFAVTVQPNKIKLQWIGQKNQIYNVLRQLKDYDLIANSYNSLADFLIQNVTGFEDTKKETIETEFKRNKDLPKPKRIKIEPGEAE
jgi:hypothetical protein